MEETIEKEGDENDAKFIKEKMKENYSYKTAFLNFILSN